MVSALDCRLKREEFAIQGLTEGTILHEHDFDAAGSLREPREHPPGVGCGCHPGADTLEAGGQVQAVGRNGGVWE